MSVPATVLTAGLARRSTPLLVKAALAATLMVPLSHSLAPVRVRLRFTVRVESPVLVARMPLTATGTSTTGVRLNGAMTGLPLQVVI